MKRTKLSARVMNYDTVEEPEMAIENVQGNRKRTLLRYLTIRISANTVILFKNVQYLDSNLIAECEAYDSHRSVSLWKVKLLANRCGRCRSYARSYRR